MPASTYRTIVVSQDDANLLDALAARALGLSLVLPESDEIRLEAYAAMRIATRYLIGKPVSPPTPTCVVCDDLGCEFCGSLVAHLAVTA